MSSTWLWYLTRAAAMTAFVLLTLTTALGVVATRRELASRWWPRFATQALHRSTSLLAMTFIVVHVLSTLLDTYVSVGWLSFVVPFTSGYDRFWVSFGTAAFDVLLLLVVTSLVRTRLSPRLWRALHWSAYAAWPLAFGHFLGTGTDAAHGRFGLYLALGCLAVVVAAVAVRVGAGRREERPATPVRSLVSADAR